MIEKLKNFICKLFGIKRCKCNSVADVPVYENEETAKQKKIRLKYKVDTDRIGEE